MIPLYVCESGGARILSLDDPAVVKDGATLAGAGGTAFVPFFTSTMFGVQFDLGYNKLRRFAQRLAHDGTASLDITGIRDEQESGVTVSRDVALSDVGIVNAALNDAGSDFQIKVEVTAYSARVAFGNAEAHVVNRRSMR